MKVGGAEREARRGVLQAFAVILRFLFYALLTVNFVHASKP